MAELKVYADRMSQPSRAIIMFCKMNKIDFEEVKVDLATGQHRNPEYREINPMQQVPAIVHGSLKLFESHAILRYLACAFQGVPDHWYPSDLSNRALIDAILDWHHSNLRRGAAALVFDTILAPIFGRPPNPQAAEEAEKILDSSLSKIESLWLPGNAKFLLGNAQPSIADLSFVCEIMQLELLEEKHRERIFGPHKKILQWIENVKAATNPNFEEVHAMLYKTKEKIHSKMSGDAMKSGP
ncbi:Glutathione transferase protein [Dioscorea alata]|uniref:Glutathione transferase protein n=1 Tax=Dioscorea alata TaxID=55571 RepID=A0ACB7VRF6_DIOAL|nr:Glutathione transferase protein [Dioscorea alata]